VDICETETALRVHSVEDEKDVLGLAFHPKAYALAIAGQEKSSGDRRRDRDDVSWVRVVSV
jgi:hypothetical protein